MSVEKQETQEDGTISDEQAEIFNRQACEMVAIFFKELASFSSDDIYKIASAKQSDESIDLLEAINRVFAQFIENGEGLPRIYFDSYLRTVTQFVDTFKLNIENKLEQNTELVIQMVTGKKTKDISYTDIARVIPTPEVEVDPLEDVPTPTVE